MKLDMGTPYKTNLFANTKSFRLPIIEKLTDLTTITLAVMLNAVLCLKNVLTTK